MRLGKAFAKRAMLDLLNRIAPHSELLASKFVYVYEKPSSAVRNRRFKGRAAQLPPCFKQPRILSRR